LKVYCVRIGEKYGQQYEDYINEKLSNYEIIWIREPIHDNVKLQWNKMFPMSLTINEPVCVVDIDIILLNNYSMLFDYPIKKGEFLSIPSWWINSQDYSINGGFFKYFPSDCNYIYDKFMSNIEYWQTYYIKNGITIGPVNGEQHFVEDSVKEKLRLKLIPASWVTRWSNGYDMTRTQFAKWHFDINQKYCKLTGNEYLYIDQFHEDIKLVHFTHAQNKPIINNSDSS